MYLPGKYGTVELYRYKDEGGFYDAEVTVSAAWRVTTVLVERSSTGFYVQVRAAVKGRVVKAPERRRDSRIEALLIL